MSSRYQKTQTERLEQYRVSFENAQNHPEITPILAEFGYDETKLAEGKQIYVKARNSYDFKIKEDDETSEVKNDFDTKYDELYKIYYLHRKKAKAVFSKDPVILKQLEIVGRIPTPYIKRIEKIRKFYSVLLNDEIFQQRLAILKVNLDDIINANSKLEEVEKARSEYLREKGESQDATKQKNLSIDDIDEWMDDFYEVAEIALEEHPQLLEVLGVFVRS